MRQAGTSAGIEDGGQRGLAVGGRRPSKADHLVGDRPPPGVVVEQVPHGLLGSSDGRKLPTRHERVLPLGEVKESTFEVHPATMGVAGCRCEGGTSPIAKPTPFVMRGRP